MTDKTAEKTKLYCKCHDIPATIVYHSDGAGAHHECLNNPGKIMTQRNSYEVPNER